MKVIMLVVANESVEGGGTGRRLMIAERTFSVV